MSIKSRFQSLLGVKKPSPQMQYRWKVDREGLNFISSPELRKSIKEGVAELWAMHQHVILAMLAEQGLAENIPSGFIVPTKTAVNLDEASREALNLPEKWQGHISASFDGRTSRTNFSLDAELEVTPGRYTGIYQLEGPLLKFSSERIFLQTPEQAQLFTALEAHNKSEKTESDNLRLVLALQDAQAAGLNISLAQFDRLDVKAPESVSLSMELDEEGNLLLTPTFGQKASAEKINKVLWQLRGKNANVIRVGGEIILLDEKRLEAVHEILKNRVVPKNKIKSFLSTPTAYIDAALVNLDVGFSARVKGIALFKQAYFGDTDESGIDWFNTSAKQAQVLPISEIISHIYNEEDLSEFQELYSDARKTNSDIISFRKREFDISSENAVNDVIEEIKHNFEKGIVPEDADDIVVDPVAGEDESPDGSDQTEAGSESDDGASGEDTLIDPINSNNPFVVNIIENDEKLQYSLNQTIRSIQFSDDQLVWDNYSRKPFAHQREGIKWVLGLSEKEKMAGALLADDMGLGKTYMSLSAMEKKYRLQDQAGKDKKPNLIVAPLSVLQNWKDEVEKTFIKSPFSDIVILQASADMKQFRLGGVEISKQDLSDSSDIATIKYSLKIGKSFFNERLDMPGRLVITTYQTLRDYQFSLCSVDWGIVVFDEAHNIKNPNAIQTRAAKGLKSDFKLLVTGTPVENSLRDFWCLMDTAVPGHLDSYQDFREQYVSPILQAAGDEVDEVRAHVGWQLRDKVGVLMLRRVKEEVFQAKEGKNNFENQVLPEKTIYVGIDEQGREENGFKYKNTLDSAMQGLQLANYQAVIDAYQDADTNHALASLHKLRDISLHPQLSEQGSLLSKGKTATDLHKLMQESEKLKSLLVQLDAINKKNEKCIVFCINKKLQEFLGVALSAIYSIPVRIINGDTKAVAKKQSADTRKSIIEAFEARVGFNIIIMSPIAAGVGLTVVGANHAIHLERHWNPAKEAQASDRIYRIGQKKPVSIYIPILHHPQFESFDVNLHRLLSKKMLLKNAVVTPEQVVPEPEMGMGSGGFKISYRITASDLVRLSWKQFEALCAELFAKKYSATHVWLTPDGADFGADVALLANGHATLLQCKHTKGATYQGYKAIQEASWAKAVYEKNLNCKVNQTFFVTNARSVPQKSRELAKTCSVKIFAHQQLGELLNKHEVTVEMLYKRLSKHRLTVNI